MSPAATLPIPLFGEGYLLTRATIRWFSERYLRGPEDAANWRASPLRADLAGLPPAPSELDRAATALRAGLEAA
jgi:acetyl esterase/lipase